MTAVAGLRGTGDWGADERPKNFRELILYRNPTGSAPIFALMARVQKESVDDPEFAWWDEPNDLVRVRINGALGAGDTAFIIDSSDPSATSPGNVWGLGKHLVPGDLLLVEPTTDNATYDHEIVEVDAVVSDTSVTMKRGRAGTTAASIADNILLTKIGNAHEEGSAEPKSATRDPIKYFNYTQIFKTVYEVTGTAGKTRLRTGDPLKNERKRKAFDHSRDIEMSVLWGQKAEVTGPGGKLLRTMDGLRAFIPSDTTTILGTSWTLDDFLDAASPVFDFDTPAGDTRIAFCGNSALNFFNKKIADASGQTALNLNYVGNSKIYGLSFMEYLMPQGRLFLRTHPLLNRHGFYKNSMFIVDFSALRWRPLRGRDTKFTDNIQAKGEDVSRGLWQTEAGLEVRYGGLTCGYIGAFNA